MLKIQRLYQPDCTVGIMTFDDFRCFTLELSWKDNQKNVSCISAGLYKCRKVFSTAFGDCIEIRDVIGRTLIRIHPANFTRQLRGCIAVGNSLQDLDKDGIIDTGTSKNTFKKLMAILPDNFLLEIN